MTECSSDMDAARRAGKKVLVFVPEPEYGGIFACEFHHGRWQTGVTGRRLPEPTHWMPLPKEPER